MKNIILPPSTLKSGLTNTLPDFQSDFKSRIAPKLYSSICSVFNGQADELFSKVINLKRPETTPTYPKPKREYWDAILTETTECLTLLKKNLKIEVAYKLEAIYDMSPYCQNVYDFAYSLSFNSIDGKPYEARVFGETPWTLGFYSHNNFVFLSDLNLDEQTLLLIKNINSFLEKSIISPKNFLDSMNYRLSPNIIYI